MTTDEMLNRYERGWRYHGILADLGYEERTSAIAFALHDDTNTPSVPT